MVTDALSTLLAQDGQARGAELEELLVGGAAGAVPFGIQIAHPHGRVVGKLLLVFATIVRGKHARKAKVARQQFWHDGTSERKGLVVGKADIVTFIGEFDLELFGLSVLLPSSRAIFF